MSVNPGYPRFQLGKALTTSLSHEDPATRERAKERIAKWRTVLEHVLSGSAKYGSRTPISDTPAWATLEVVQGGFATGVLLAGGSLQEHEKDLISAVAGDSEPVTRLWLNAHFLTDTGLAQLQEWLRTGCYDVKVPEEGALLVVAWLIERGKLDEARSLVEELSTYFTRLRFYPAPRATPLRSGALVHLQDVSATTEALLSIEPNERILTQRRTAFVWAPFHDRVVAHLLETVEDGWPCQLYPDGWRERAFALLAEFAELTREHVPSNRWRRESGHSAQLRVFLGRCARDPTSLTGREVARIRAILHAFLAKRGEPKSVRCLELRRRQRAEVSAPTYDRIAQVIIERLSEHDPDEGLDTVDPLLEPVGAVEAQRFGLPAGTAIPASIIRKVKRCVNETPEGLIESGLISSGDTLARILPQMTSGIRAAGLADPSLRRLYAALYRAFRRRRSLLLLNLEKQVQMGELPWIAAMEEFRSDEIGSQDVARQALEEITVTAMTSFPHAILPNKLLQELRALVKGAGLDIPIVDELAADIFMGKFTVKFRESAKVATELLSGTLYSTYYEIDHQTVHRLPSANKPPVRTWFGRATQTTGDPLAALCASRAGVALGTRDAATNGMVIEQQQILTTQNLAVLFRALGLRGILEARLAEMAKMCFRWICRRHRMKVDSWHARLIRVKNTAHAWRQMVFFLSMAHESDLDDFLRWAEEHLELQPDPFRQRFRPALRGLLVAAAGSSIDQEVSRGAEIRRFTGWSKTRHWLLVEG